MLDNSPCPHPSSDNAYRRGDRIAYGDGRVRELMKELPYDGEDIGQCPDNLLVKRKAQRGV